MSPPEIVIRLCQHVGGIPDIFFLEGLVLFTEKLKFVKRLLLHAHAHSKWDDAIWYLEEKELNWTSKLLSLSKLSADSPVWIPEQLRFAENMVKAENDCMNYEQSKCDY